MAGGWRVVIVVASGCYVDAQAGVQHAGGGVTGWGWEGSLTGGVGFDLGHIVRPSAGVDATMTRVKGRDGKLGVTGFGYHGRLDVTVHGKMVAHDDVAAAHPGMEVPDGDVLALTRIILDYGYGHEDLSFTPHDNPMEFKVSAPVHRMYLGIAQEYASGGVQASFSIGPNVTLIPNDFVGNTTMIGGQFHAAFWFFPEFSRKQSSGHYESGYTPSDVEKPLPTAPADRCHDDYGNTVPC